MKPDYPQEEQVKDTTFPEELSKHLTETTKPVAHSQLLADLLNNLSPVDFPTLSQTDRVQEKHYRILTIEELLKKATINGWGLCSSKGKPYLFNGAFWEAFTEEKLQYFLGEVAEKFGVDHFKATDYRFKQDLVKQFSSTSALTYPEPSPELVLFNLQNGTFEVNAKTGEKKLRQAKKEDFLTYQLPFEYKPQAKAPTFQSYLDKVLPEQEKQLIIAEYLGWIFIKHSSGILKLEKALILCGDGRNGKSVFFDTVKALFGQKYFSTYSLETITNPKGYERIEIGDKLLNYCSEISGKLNASSFKQMVSGEPIEAQRKYQDPVILQNYAKFIFNSNELPKEVEQTKGFFRRFLIVPFEVTISEEETDTGLAQKIIEKELSGVFNWALEGLERLLTNKSFTYCQACSEAVDQYRKESDSVSQFIEEEGLIKSQDNKIRLSELYGKYQYYCLQSGFNKLNSANFKKRLIKLGFQNGRTGELSNYFLLQYPSKF